MESRYLSNLNAAISCSHDSNEINCLRAERASYLARRGNSAAAEAELSALRVDGSNVRSATISSWINFAEGMRFHCNGMDREASDKWQRSRAIADSVGLEYISSLVSSWFLFLDYTCADISSMKDSLQRCLIDSTQLNNQAKSRLALTIAQCFHVFGDIQSAKRWYTLSRLKALAYGDDVMLSALIHNMAWIRVSNARNEVLRGFSMSDSRDLIYLGAETTVAYEGLVGISSFGVMTPLLQAQVQILNEQYSFAEDLITRNIDNIENSGIGRVRASLLADRAYCRALVGSGDSALMDVKAALSLACDDIQIDDLAALHSRVALTYMAIDMEEQAQLHRVYANEKWTKFDIFRQDLLSIAKLADDVYAEL